MSTARMTPAFNNKPWEQQIYTIHANPKRLEILTRLKAEGADFSAKEVGIILKGSGYTLAHYAMYDFQEAFDANLEYLQFLFENGAKPNAVNNYGKTPLHEFFHKSTHFEGLDEKVIALCCKNGFNINSKDNDGRTVLHIASLYGRDKAVECLLERDADIQAVDESKLTPLHVAAAAGKPLTTELLIAKCASCLVTDKLGRTPLQYTKDVLEEELKHRQFSQLQYQYEFCEPYREVKQILRDRLRMIYRYGSLFSRNNIVLPDIAVEIIGNFDSFKYS